MGTMHTQQSAAVGAQHAKVTASLRRFNDREANVRRRILGSTPGSAVIGKKNAGVRPPCRLVWSRAETAAEAQAICHGLVPRIPARRSYSNLMCRSLRLT
jgi:hypothetical protein